MILLTKLLLFVQQDLKLLLPIFVSFLGLFGGAEIFISLDSSRKCPISPKISWWIFYSGISYLIGIILFIILILTSSCSSDLKFSIAAILEALNIILSILWHIIGMNYSFILFIYIIMN